jgi:hypothetical protein
MVFLEYYVFFFPILVFGEGVIAHNLSVVRLLNPMS